MIPKLLIIKGLYSYQTQQTIDFEKLTEAGLFGIFGNVGAGKSSILEAIMFALYGEVERMGKANRNYNILNLSSDSLLIQFDFDIDGKLYRSKVTGHRNSRKRSDVNIKQPLFYEKKEGEFYPLSISTAEDLIGLKLSDFKKTIIIPQGTFQDFLQLRDSERTEMMSKLFGLERFDLDPKAKILQLKNNEELEIQKAQLALLGDANKEEIEQKKSELIDLHKFIEIKQTELKQKREQDNQFSQLKQDFDLQQNLQKKYTVLMARDGEFLQFEKQLNDYEKTYFTFSNIVKDYDKLAQDLVQNQKNLNQKTEKFTKNDVLIQDLVKTKTELTPQYEQRETLKKQAEEVKKALNIRKIDIEIEKTKASLHKGFSFLEDKLASVQELKSKFEIKEKEKNSLANEQPNWVQLNAVKDWFSINSTIETELIRLEKETQKKAETIDTLYISKNHLISNSLPTFGIRLNRETKISDVIAANKAKIEALKTASEKLQHEQIHLKTTEQLEAWATQLSEGEACPLCGATHHPSVMQAHEVRQSLKQLNEQLSQYKNEIKTLENIDQELFTLNTSFQKESKELEKLNATIQEEKKKKQVHLSGFRWQPQFSPLDYSLVKLAFEKAEKIDIQKNSFDKELGILQKQIAEFETTVESCKKRIGVLENEKTAAEATKQVLLSLIELLNFEEITQKPESDLVSWIESLDNQYIVIEKIYFENEHKLQKCQSEAQILRGGIETLKQSQNQLEQDFEALKTDLAAKLGEQNLANIRSILAQKIDLNKERQKLLDFKNEKLLVNDQLLKINEKMMDKPYSHELHSKLSTEIQELDRAIQSQLKLVGELSGEIQDKEKRSIQIEQIKKQQRKTGNRAENIKLLRGLFQGKGFVNYASSVFLKSIIDAANQRFISLTKHQLSLQITESNNFIICDRLNDGQTRDVRTLSGGQTFQAALCLALSLSDHIQSRNQARQNFFFLDEGFGSLDKDTLQTVFDTLKALRKENRIVGIISHVEDMRSEIDRYLNVQLTESNGSKVELVLG